MRKRLGRWLLGHEPVSPGTDAETRFSCRSGVPIYLTYITAQVRDGKLSLPLRTFTAGIKAAATQFASQQLSSHRPS